MSPPTTQAQTELLEDMAFGFASIPASERLLISAAQAALERWAT